MLETIWFVLWGILWAVYFMLDGFDFGIGMLLPFLGKDETKKRIMYKATGPFWDGNEVWLIAAGGVTFAAFPSNYAVMFSALYSPLMLILFALIIRGLSIEFRNKLDNKNWRSIWDWCLFISSLLPALLFGVAFANIFSGIPINEDGIFQGTILSLLTPYGLIGGITFVLLFLMHGSLWMAVKSEGELHNSSVSLSNRFWGLFVVAFFVFVICTKLYTNIFNNYFDHLLLLFIPVISIVALMLIKFFLSKHALWKAWFSSSITIVTITLFGLLGIYPNLLPSSINSDFSMTIYNSSSSPLTLKIMLGVVLVFIPIVIAYQAWAYYLFKHKITEADLSKEEGY